MFRHIRVKSFIEQTIYKGVLTPFINEIFYVKPKYFLHYKW